jgi:Flp pilus assembly protein TadG
MKITSRKARGQGGFAAVELAIMLPFMVALLALALLAGRLLWHYTVAQKAAHDAARYMSTVPAHDIVSTRVADAQAVGQQILEEEMSELNQGEMPRFTRISCISPLDATDTCNGLTTPTSVSAAVTMRIDDIFLLDVILSQPIIITAKVTMPYVGQ